MKLELQVLHDHRGAEDEIGGRIDPALLTRIVQGRESGGFYAVSLSLYFTLVSGDIGVLLW